jgi:hypothetical protein
VRTWNATLTRNQLIAAQWGQYGGNVPQPAWAVNLGYQGTGTQLDYTGGGKNGTVTGATVSDHQPIPTFFGFSPDRDPGGFTALSGTLKKFLLLGVG